MRAKTIEGLKIYKYPDGTYEATRDGFLYTFMWKPYKVYNLKKVGGIGPTWSSSGRLVKNPPQQMILQLQRGINALNETSMEIYDKLVEGFYDHILKM